MSCSETTSLKEECFLGLSPPVFGVCRIENSRPFADGFSVLCSQRSVTVECACVGCMRETNVIAY